MGEGELKIQEKMLTSFMDDPTGRTIFDLLLKVPIKLNRYIKTKNKNNNWIKYWDVEIYKNKFENSGII